MIKNKTIKYWEKFNSYIQGRINFPNILNFRKVRLKKNQFKLKF